MQRRDGTMPGICPMGLQKGQGGEQKGGRETQRDTHTDREERERDRQRQGEGGRDRDTDREEKVSMLVWRGDLGLAKIQFYWWPNGFTHSSQAPQQSGPVFSELPGEHTKSSFTLPCLAFESDAHMSCGWWCISDTC